MSHHWTTRTITILDRNISSFSTYTGWVVPVWTWVSRAIRVNGFLRQLVDPNRRGHLASQSGRLVGVFSFASIRAGMLWSMSVHVCRVLPWYKKVWGPGWVFWFRLVTGQASGTKSGKIIRWLNLKEHNNNKASSHRLLELDFPSSSALKIKSYSADLLWPSVASFYTLSFGHRGTISSNWRMWTGVWWH